jgi:N-acetylglucosaminyl-diphospho-decaprenol L-rhamnosyltransferase
MAGVNAPSNVSVVVVSFNTREKLRRCLSCIEPEHEVIVVDNVSTDGSLEMIRSEFPQVRLIENSDNVGFGAANNQGMEIARRDLILFLNSDCYADPGAISFLAVAFTYPALNVVAAGGVLRNMDGSDQKSVANELTLGAVFLEQTFLERIAGRWSYWQLSQRILGADRKPVAVYQVTGACLMIRPVEKFDERFFMYCEDTELCYRLKNHGDIVFWSEPKFTHELGSSSAGARRWLGVARYNRGKELYFAIHHGWFACGACWIFDRLGALLRLLIWGVPCLLTLGLVGRLRRQTWIFIRVLTAPLRGPRRPSRSGR